MQQKHYIHSSQILSVLSSLGINNDMSQRIAMDMSRKYNKVTFTRTVELYYNANEGEYVVTITEPLPHAQ